MWYHMWCHSDPRFQMRQWHHQQTAPCVLMRTMRTMRTKIGVVRSPLKLRTSCVPAAYHCVPLHTKNLVRSWYAVGTHAYQLRTNCVPDFWYAVVRNGTQLVRSFSRLRTTPILVRMVRMVRIGTHGAVCWCWSRVRIQLLKSVRNQRYYCIQNMKE